MEPGSTASNLTLKPSQPLANLIGTLIALLTLTVPMVAIAYFSSDSFSSGNFSTSGSSWQAPPQIVDSRE